MLGGLGNEIVPVEDPVLVVSCAGVGSCAYN